MSLIITTHVREGIVMASDSRLSLSFKNAQGTYKGIPFSDSNYKTFLTNQHYGISVCGTADINGTPIAGYIETFIHEVLGNRQVSIYEVAKELLNYFNNLKDDLRTIFHVAGFEKHVDPRTNKEESVQKFYRVLIHGDKIIDAINPKDPFGASWDGETMTMIKLLTPMMQVNHKNPKDTSRKLPNNGISFTFFTLQDAIDFNRYAIRTTIDTLKFERAAKTVGGPIDILVIKPNEAVWIARKSLQ